MAEKELNQILFIGEKMVPVQPGQTILEASLAAGIPHYHACGGKAQCSTCRVLVTEGAENLSEPNVREKLAQSRIKFPNEVRLACQTQVIGQPVKLHRIIRDETDRCLYINDASGEDMLQAIGEEKKLTLFFLDIRDFTPFMQAHLPFDVIHIMRRLFRIFSNAITSHQGRIIETAGDGLYAVFGLETSLRNAVQAAVNAGNQIFRDLEVFNQTYLQHYFNYYLQVGIGLHVGRVILGNIGIGVNNNLSVMGFPVNVAARLQNATKELNNNFVISAKAFQLLKNQPQETICTNINLKGVKEAFAVYLIGQPFRKPATLEANILAAE
ncbi:adenylate/guanylate cyclase domain-containing protein [Adhaeribacter rhizoryzae]|uniref:Adenylate/guanylate cyclase domain-containing protein n=1 Tax=Adhaeribacter rhizoryzae TaxID=2607907 RepID=A0A5M6D7Y3_9BACT|nr:adenylate/guanylate cyclase domain-containing protein [Adhaeribacter rhizoryzae]KAA5543463.1 adenylate/guanylate cyclase domain-containing protein [Adhaeribacter rhizoryzae]